MPRFNSCLVSALRVPMGVIGTWALAWQVNPEELGAGISLVPVEQRFRGDHWRGPLGLFALLAMMGLPLAGVVLTALHARQRAASARWRTVLRLVPIGTSSLFVGGMYLLRGTQIPELVYPIFVVALALAWALWPAGPRLTDRESMRDAGSSG